MNRLSLPHSVRPALAALACALASSLAAQAPVPSPALVDGDQPVVLTSAEPLRSLEEQIEMSGFDRRGALATAYDEANRWVDFRVATLRSQGLDFVDEAEVNLADAREIARNAFRDLSLTTVETWGTAQHNAVMALRRIKASLEDLERTATLPR